MTPKVPDAAGSKQKRAQRTVPRIIPAVPLALSRAPPSTRPITPEETVAESTPAQQDAPEVSAAQASKGEKGEDTSAGAVQSPPTPDSRAFAGDDLPSEEGAPVESPLEASHHNVVEPLDTRGSDAEEEQHTADAPSPIAAPRPSNIAVNGNHNTATPPAELPPPFYPSKKPATRTPTAQTPTYEAAHISPLHPSTVVPSQHPAPRPEGIVFGVAQESPAIPSTPHEAEPDNRPSQQYMPRPATGFPAPQFAAPFHPGHSHHFSNNTAPWLYPPYTMAPPDGLYTGRDYHPSLFSEQNAVHGVYQGHFSSAHASGSMNGRSHTPRSPARSSAKAQSEHDGEPVVVPQQNGVSSAAVDPKIDNTPFELAGYLSSQFGNPEFADFVLQIHSDGAKLLSIPVHGIVVARSQAIASAIRSAMPISRSKDSRTLVDIFASNKLLTTEALNEAMKILYGAPLLSPQAFLYGMRPYHPDGEQAPSFVEARRRMAQVLSYAATGEELQLHSMVVRGVEIAKALLRWDTFDQPLCLALESGVPASGTTDSYKTTLLYDVVNFVAYNFPVDFALFSIAPELAQMPRIPNIIESRNPSHNPRLSKIRFGDVPPEDELKPSHMTRILSSALLSLPLTVLEYLLNHPALANRLGWGAVVQVMQATIEERENRRTKALQQQNKPAQDGALPQSLMENLYWEERVEPSSEHTSGYKLSERRIASHV